ncbi:MAG: zf-HC2 domain-containing protein [Acidimicrobiia bacterium]
MTSADDPCALWRDAVSARADGEDPGIDARLLDAHLDRCVACRRYRDTVEALRRPMRVVPAPAVPDLAGPVVRARRLAVGAGRWGVARGLLVVVAVQIAVLSLPSLLLADGGTAGHDARHLGAFTVAYAIGLGVVALRPARARTMLPVAGVLAVALLLTAVVDVTDGRVPLSGEIVHLPEVFSVGLVWALAVPVGRARHGRSRLVGRLARRLPADDRPVRRAAPTTAGGH